MIDICCNFIVQIRIYWIRQDDRVSEFSGKSVYFTPPNDIWDKWHYMALVGDWDGSKYYG